MTAPSSINPARFLHDQLASASPDLLRQMLTTFYSNTLMSAEAGACVRRPVRDAVTGSGECPQLLPAPGLRHPGWHPGCGDPEAAVRVVLPGLAAGTAPERRGSTDAVVAMCYLLGVSTRRMEKLVESLGITAFRSPPNMAPGGWGSSGT